MAYNPNNKGIRAIKYKAITTGVDYTANDILLKFVFLQALSTPNAEVYWYNSTTDAIIATPTPAHIVEIDESIKTIPKGSTLQGEVTSTNINANRQGLDVILYDGSGNIVSPTMDTTNYNQAGVIAINTDLVVIDCSRYKHLSIQCTSMGTGGVVTPQWTDDPLLTVRVTATLTDVAGAESSTFNAPVKRSVNVQGRYFILRLTTATTGGTTNIFINASQTATPLLKATQAISGSVSLAAGTNAIGDVGVQYRANATGAASRNHLVSAATTNPTIVKASAGRVVGWSIANTTATWRYVKLHNQATSPTAGAGVVLTLAVPPDDVRELAIQGGIGFTTGISYTTVTGAADNDATAVGAGDLIIDLFFA